MVETRRSSASTKRPPSGPSPSTPPSSKRPKEEAGVSPKGQREESNKEAAAAADNQQLNSDQPGKDPPTEAAKPGVDPGYAVQTLAGERATKAESRNHGLSSVDNSSRKSTTEGCMGKAYFTALSAQKSKTGMPLFTETPETEIARRLAHLLIGRIFDVIHRLRQHQDSKVHIANAGLEQLREILLDDMSLRFNNLHKKISNKFLQDWLWRYKDFFYMTEDVLDDLDFIPLPSDKPQGDALSASDEQMLIFMKAMEKLLEVIDAATGLFREIKDLMKGTEEFLQIYSRLEKQQVTRSELPTLPYKVRELKG